jgi:hypothetical protein
VSYVEKRREPRYELTEIASMVALSLTEDESLEARTLDVSKSGLKLRVNRMLKPGMPVEVRWPGSVVFGEIRYCNESAPRQFEAGIHVEHFFSGTSVLAEGHVSKTNLALFHIGRLPETDREVVEMHLQACAKCKSDLSVALGA